MRIRKRNRIIRRVVLGFAVVALVVPGAAMARVDEKGQGGVVLADPKYGQTSDVAGPIELRDFPKSLPPVELGTYGLPHAGLNDYLQTHNGKAMVDSRDNVSTPQVVVDSKGFDWGDAGIGAAILVAFMVVLGGGTLAARQLRRPQTA